MYVQLCFYTKNYKSKEKLNKFKIAVQKNKSSTVVLSTKHSLQYSR